MTRDGHHGEGSLGSSVGQVVLEADWHKHGSPGPAKKSLHLPQDAGHHPVHHVVCLLPIIVLRWGSASCSRLLAAYQLLRGGISKSGHQGGWAPAARHWQSSEAPPIVAAKSQGGQGPELSPGLALPGVSPQLRSGVATTGRPRLGSGAARPSGWKSKSAERGRLCLACLADGGGVGLCSCIPPSG